MVFSEFLCEWGMIQNDPLVITRWFHLVQQQQQQQPMSFPLFIFICAENGNQGMIHSYFQQCISLFQVVPL